MGRWCCAFAALVWISASVLFEWYAANFGRFNKTYGSLTWIVVLVGGRLNAETERRPAQPAALP